ncbi:MAG: hypothetical protein ACU0CI_07085 [Shimia sp.]
MTSSWNSSDLFGGWFTIVPTGIWQARIAGTVVALGWMVNGHRVRREARRLRDERLRDAHKALFAEIRTTLAQFAEAGPDVTNALLARMRENDGFVPLIPRERHDRIYSALIAAIDVLPRATIDQIVAYYATIEVLREMAEDIRSEAFGRLEQPRRIAIISDFFATRRRAFSRGELALAVVKAYAEGGADAAEAAAGRLSSPVAGRSAPPVSGEGD